MAGLLAGRVLADHFERVTIIERDRIAADAEPRKGVPQGRHSHVLLYKGVRILTELFPDLCPALVQHGSTVVDASADVRWYHFGGWKVPDLYEAIKDAEPLTPIAIHRFPANQRRRYERLARFPEGFLVLGDAACSFNPIYGQRMTTAALAAQALNDCLHRQQRLGDDTGFARRCQRAIARAVAVPWQLATSEDFRYPDTQGERPVGTRLLNWYTGRVHELATSRPYVTRRFYEVLHMLKPPTALFDPRILVAVVFAGRLPRTSRSDLKKTGSAMMKSRSVWATSTSPSGSGW
jgi:2-polyprenyl-6-methoxyphenol hydroxylase-like FAD-dependent oxidoreductase